MALYKSAYTELSFYVDKERKQFSNGEYRTDAKKEIEVLDKLLDAVRVDKEEPKAEEPKATPKKKASAK
jgi:hypothetical protein